MISQKLKQYPARSTFNVLLGMGLFLVFLNNFWMGDDGFISFRTMSNFLDGFGLRWNIDERVQSYTNPLWLFYIAVIYAPLGTIYFSVLIGSGLLFVAVLWMVMRNIDSQLKLVCLAALMILSKAFMEYTSSGLENILSYALLTLYFFSYMKIAPTRLGDESEFEARESWKLSLLCALLFLNRMDSILLVAVPHLHIAVLHLKRWKNEGIKPIVFFLAPFLLCAAWLLFSLIYYGFVLPNTFYAKTNFPVETVRWKFISGYYRYALFMDPLLLVVPICALVFSSLKSFRRYLPFVIGIILTNLYIIRVGGDFMGGRWLTLPYLVALLILAHGVPVERFKQLNWRQALAAGLVLLIASAVSNRLMRYNPFVGGTENPLGLNPYLYGGVIDERLTLGQFTRITKCAIGLCYNYHPLYQQALEIKKKQAQQPPKKIISGGAMGLLGFGVGPHVKIIDEQGLCDPLLARIQGKPVFPGHYKRAIPEGYDEPGHKIKDPRIAEYYAGLKIITQGPLFTRERWKHIVDYNLGSRKNLKQFLSTVQPAK